MNIESKILLGSKDIIIKDDSDIYLSFEIFKTFSEIKRENINNSFDLQQKFESDRNSIFNFRIYGQIDHLSGDSNNLNIKVFSDSGFTKQILTTKTLEIGQIGNLNIFGYTKGQYLIELDNVIPMSGVDYVMYLQIYNEKNVLLSDLEYQKLIYVDTDGNFVPYGQEYIDFNINSTTKEISNDYYFLYNKHWIKKNIFI